jgi:hypothetical protein
MLFEYRDRILPSKVAEKLFHRQRSATLMV